MMFEQEGMGERREAVLNINRVEGIDKLGNGTFFCRAVLLSSNSNISPQKFKTAPNKNGNWDQEFSFVYANGNDEIEFEICETKWFGREHVVGAAKSSISDLLHKKHVTLWNSPGRVYVKLFDHNRCPLPNTRRLSGKKRVKREMSSESVDFDMTEYFQKKIEVHRSMIDSLNSLAPDPLCDENGDDQDQEEEELRRELGAMEASLRHFNKKNTSFRSMLDSLDPSNSGVTDDTVSSRGSSLCNSRSNSFCDSLRSSMEFQGPIPGAAKSSPVQVLVLQEKVKVLQSELESERGTIAVLKKRNVELEIEVQTKTQELLQLKQKDSLRDKVVWESLSKIDLFDQKIQKIEQEREAIRECEKRLAAQEKELQKREAEIQKSLNEMVSQKDVFTKAIQDTQDGAKLQPLLDSWAAPQRQLEEKLNAITSHLSKIDQLTAMVNRLEGMATSGGFSHSAEKAVGSKRGAAEIKAEMEALHQVIMNASAPEKDREAANLKIDRLFIELSGTDEYKMEIKRAHEEKMRINEPLNKEALQNVLQKWAACGNDPELLARKRQYPALTVIGMERDQLLGKHQNDFNQYNLTDLSLEEVRAIRASLPNFRKDQKKQLEFVESVELKIDQLVKNPPPAAKPKKAPFSAQPKNLTKLKAQGRASMSLGGCSMANITAEIAKRRAVEV